MTIPTSNGVSDFRFQSALASMQDTVNFELDEYLQSIIDSLHITPEEFARLYTLEMEPLQIDCIEDTQGDQIRLRATQLTRVRRKTDEEMFAQEHPSVTQGEK